MLPVMAISLLLSTAFFTRLFETGEHNPCDLHSQILIKTRQNASASNYQPRKRNHNHVMAIELGMERNNENCDRKFCCMATGCTLLPTDFDVVSRTVQGLWAS